MDGLLELLRQKQKVSLAEAAKTLGIDEHTIKLWVDFLVEEKVVGIEYKFTKPYVYLNKPKGDKKGKIIAQEKVDIDHFKQDFEQRAQQSSIPQQQVGFLWKDHVMNQLELEKPFFFREARKRGLEGLDDLWEAYKQELMKR